MSPFPWEANHSSLNFLPAFTLKSAPCCRDTIPAAPKASPGQGHVGPLPTRLPSLCPFILPPSPPCSPWHCLPSPCRPHLCLPAARGFSPFSAARPHQTPHQLPLSSPDAAVAPQPRFPSSLWPALVLSPYASKKPSFTKHQGGASAPFKASVATSPFLVSHCNTYSHLSLPIDHKFLVLTFRVLSST